ncbi:MAG: hypothetical protein MRY57_03380 [Candidatus Pacebacteria bacterium]|nr:hypothetical protein [Candidatus Paceibacterota bacterium]
MILLPPIYNSSMPRPHRPNFEETYLVPDTEKYPEFWNKFYDYVTSLKFHSPVLRNIKNYINPLFGYFGYRVHPVTKEPRYFHTGVSLDLKSGRKIHAILPGILEYSGFGAINGHYVLISHPQIQTEDGYVLHSMYCHLKKPLVKFNSYQKMLREISLGSYPELPIETKAILGTASTSGLSRDHYPGLYLQLSFRKFGETPIVIDPLRAYFNEIIVNETANMLSQKSIERVFKKKSPK